MNGHAGKEAVTPVHGTTVHETAKHHTPSSASVTPPRGRSPSPQLSLQRTLSPEPSLRRTPSPTTSLHRTTSPTPSAAAMMFGSQFGPQFGGGIPIGAQPTVSVVRTLSRTPPRLPSPGLLSEADARDGSVHHLEEHYPEPPSPPEEPPEPAPPFSVLDKTGTAMERAKLNEGKKPPKIVVSAAAVGKAATEKVGKAVDDDDRHGSGCKCIIM